MHKLNVGAVCVFQRCRHTGNGPLASYRTSWDKCRCRSLGREALVTVMKSSDLRKRNCLSAVGRLDGPSVGRTLPGRQVRVALVLPHCNAQSMHWHLDEIWSQVTPSAHAALFVDQAG
jgi:hypothetical protein